MPTYKSLCAVCHDEFNDVFGFDKCTRCLARELSRSDARIAAALTEFEAARKIPDAAIAITRLIDELRRRVAN
jgi:hypothetical protein